MNEREQFGQPYPVPDWVLEERKRKAEAEKREAKAETYRQEQQRQFEVNQAIRYDIQLRVYRRTAFWCFIFGLVFLGLTLFFGMMSFDVWTTQLDIPTAMRTPRQNMALWPAFPTLIFGFSTWVCIGVWMDAKKEKKRKR